MSDHERPAAGEHPSLLRGAARGMALGGEAVFALDDGRVVFVPRGAPGDVAELEMTHTTRGVAHGRLEHLLEPGPGRVEPPCPFFRAGCGGCQWQQLSYQAQLDQKQDLLRETLRRIGHLADVPLLAPLPAPDPWHYRTAIQLHVDADGRVAFTSAHSHDLIAVTSCPISHPLLDRLIAALSSPLAVTILRDRVTAISTIAARVASADGADRLLLLLRTTGGRPRAARRLIAEIQTRVPEIAGVALLDTAEATGGRRGPPVPQPLSGEPFLAQDVAGRRFYVGPSAFFQVNAPQTERLVDIVRERVDAERPAKLLDLYSGVGLFALSVTDLANEIIGYESDPEAVELAERALEYQALAQPAPPGREPRVRFLRRAVETLSAEELRGAGVVVLDPPRAGLAGRLIDQLVAAVPACLIYISCEPSSLARDLRRLTGAGWRLDSVQLLDMFPQTYHIESVSVLRRP